MNQILRWLLVSLARRGEAMSRRAVLRPSSDAAAMDFLPQHVDSDGANCRFVHVFSFFFVLSLPAQVSLLHTYIGKQKIGLQGVGSDTALFR